jgi:rod shape-determining protein MreD
MINRRDVRKWALCALIMLLTAVIQGTPNALPAIFGVYPLIIIPCAVAVAIFEGETAGAALAVFGGLIWDVEGGLTFGFNALFLMILCVAVAMLIQNLFRRTLVSAIMFCLAVTLVHQSATWFFFVYIAGRGTAFPLLNVLLPSAAYTAPFMILYYFIFRAINSKFRDAGISMDNMEM